MSFGRTIGAKIFGLVIFLLLLTVALSILLLYEVSHAQAELRGVALFEVPLEESAARIDEYGLRRRLAFERWFGALNAGVADANPEVVAEASANYEEFTQKVNAEFVVATRLLASPEARDANVEQIAQVRALLQQIEAEYPLMTAHQRKVLALQQTGDRAAANGLLNPLNDLQRLVQTQRATLQERMGSLVVDAVAASTRHQRYVFTLTIAATASTVLLGLGVAFLIVKRLTRPVQSLMTAMRDVQGGNLDVRLPVRSADEVGALTESFNFFVSELRSKEQIKRTFGKYVDPRVLEQLLTQPGQAAPDAAGGRRVMTVMFADLVGFTNMSERLTPARMVTLLNRHFGLQAQAVQDHLGVVDKFLGDCVMAFWGPPFVPAADHALLACRAALAQVRMLQTLRAELPELTGMRKDAPTIDLRIGLCTGEVVVGNIGSENTRNFTVIGDTVNLTSRIEGANRIYGTQTLIGDTTAQAVASQFELREVDSLAVKGKTEPARVFELLGPAGTLSDEDRRLRDAYAEALAAYRAQKWADAESAFDACLMIRPTDGPSLAMLNRLPALRQAAPGAAWDGTWHMAEK